MEWHEHFKTLALAAGAVTAVTVLTGATAEQPTAPTAVLAGRNTIAAGTIASGSTPVVGATVTGRLWPNQATQSALKTGQRIRFYDVGSTRTDSSGRFRLGLNRAALPAMYRGEAGRVEVELIVSANRRAMKWSYTATARGVADWSTTLADLDRRPEPANLAIDFGTGSAVTVREARAGRAAKTRSVVSKASAQADGPCSIAPSTWHYGLNERYARAFAWSGAYATVTQSNGVDHTLGIGLHDSRGWVQTGTSTTNMAGASATRGRVADAYSWNRTNYRDFVGCGVVYKRPQTLYAFFTNWTYAGHANWTADCVTYTGGTYTKTQGRNYTQYSGMNIEVMDVNAQSGWSTQGEIKWDVTARTKLCASSSVGWATSSEATASPG